MGIIRSVACALALALPLCAAAQEGKPNIEDFIRKDRFQQVKISPKGTYLAATVPVDDKTVLVVLKPGETKPYAHFNLRGKTHVMGFWWASDDRLLFTVGKKDGALETPVPLGEIWGMNADGSKTGVLVGWQQSNQTDGRTGAARREPVAAAMVDPLEDDDAKAIISVYKSGTSFTSAERMDVRNGSRVPLAQAPVENASFVTDRKGEVRFAIGSKNDNTSKLYYRKEGSSSWTLVNDEAVTGKIVSPLGFSGDNGTAYLQSQEKTGPDAVVAFDVATEQSRQVSRDAVVNPTGLFNGVGKSYPIGVLYESPKPRFEYFEPASADARLHRSLQSGFDGEPVFPGATTTDKGEVLLLTTSDRNPGDYFAFDLAKKSAAHMIARKDWIAPMKMAQTRGIEFKARDGRPIHGLLTVPHGSDGKNLPMVVNPHGGPFGISDSWGYEDERQLLASRGYAVLQVNFRGSGGYGRDHMLAGYKQWGRTMQDDLTDATRWAIQQGVANPGRICIYGASYGGYASLMGVAKEPTLYKCAIGYVGVYDLQMMHRRGDVPQRLSGVNFLKDALGTEGLEDTSPNRIASRIKVPVLLAAGGEDQRAPKEHTEAMERALRSAGVPVEYLYYPTEGHGFYKIEHAREFYTRMLALLDRTIGPGAGAQPSAVGRAGGAR